MHAERFELRMRLFILLPYRIIRILFYQRTFNCYVPNEPVYLQNGIVLDAAHYGVKGWLGVRKAGEPLDERFLGSLDTTELAGVASGLLCNRSG